MFSSHPFWTSSSLDVPAGVTQTGGRSHRIFNPPSFCGACLHPLGIFILFFFVFSEKNPVCRESNSRPNVSEGYEVPTELPGSTGCVFCYSCSFLFVVFCVFVFFFCSHWSLVNVPLIFFCPADHVPDWQPRSILLGMVEARSVNVKKTTTVIIGPL